MVSQGDTGPDVVRLQNQLIELDYLSGPPNGVFGAATDTALRSFQQDYGLLVDGVCAAIVRQALQQLSRRTQ